jgi:hypothetical protein
MIDQSWISDQNRRVLDKKTIARSSKLGWFCSGGFAKLVNQQTIFWPSDFERNTINS